MKRRAITAALVIWAAMAGWQGIRATEPAVHPGGLAIPVPESNPSTPAKIELGKLLYFDPRLSVDHTISCASCHDPNKGWSNGEPTATGVAGKKGGRNSPTVINTALQKFQFWDGRAGTLEEQALGPMQNPIEMNMSLDLVVERLNASPEYVRRFEEVFGARPTAETAAMAIAAFERTIVSLNAPYDRWMGGDKTAMSASAARGKELFFGKAHCSACHVGVNFTDNAFHNLGVGMNVPQPDPGRAAISKLEGDTGAFKTPTLREIARSAPYMHDGSLATLEAVVEHYNKGGTPNDYLDEEIFPLDLSAGEQADLVTFLKEGLSSDEYPAITPPQLPQ